MSRDSAACLDSVAAAMRDFPAPWFFCGGWAIDLFLGEVTRKHADIDVGIFRREQQLLWQCLPEWTLLKALHVAGTGHWEQWMPGEALQLPVHQIAATRQATAEEFQILLHEGDRQTWAMRRHPALTRPAGEIVATAANGMPYLVPEVQLLFKAKNVRPKDEADFARVAPRPSEAPRAWLRQALRHYYPTHAWLPVLHDVAS